MNNQSIHPTTFRERLFPFLCGLILLAPASILTFVAGGIGIESLTEQWRLKNWSMTSAIVEGTQSIRQTSGKYKVSIRYRYTFHGNEFHSQRYEPFNSNKLFDSTKAEDFVLRYPIGSTITAYVDPAKPRHAFVKASKSSGLLACLGIVFFLTGLYLTGHTIYFMWRSVTAFCIVRVSRSFGSGTGIRFYFYDSLEAATKAADWTPSPEGVLKPSQFRDRLKPFLGGLLFASVGIAGLIVLIALHNRLPQVVVVTGFILMPAFSIMGIGLMWSASIAKYILDRKGSFDQEEISLLDSPDVPPP